MYNKTMTAILRELDTQTETGLSSEEAKRRLDEYGMNRLKEGKKQGILSRLWGQLRDPMILVLLAAAALSLFAGGGTDWADAIIILLIVVVNACISISQEDNARRALSALRELSAPMARVLRDGTQMRIDASLLVPGDIIFLEAGDYVPADARLCSAISLKADESAMTGESLSANKTTVDSLPIGTALGDRKNMVIAATVITAGRGTAIVTATGMDTEVGKIANLILKQDDIKTPLQKKMSEISKTLSFVCVAVCFVMFGVGLLQHKDMLDLFLTAVSLAVAAIPEGLPAIVTIVLAMGVQRMAKFHAIVKKLPAVETLGCASVICSDKTGTCTHNKMTVVEIWSPEDAFRADVLRLAALCNNAKRKIEKDGTVSILGDPTECALVELAALEGIDKNRLEREMPRKSEVPFDSARKRMSTVHRLPNGTYRVAVKGAPDVLLPLCTRSISRRGTTPIGRPEAERILGVNAGMASRALRVIAVAYRDLKEVPRNMDASFLEWDLTFVGLSGMIDPPRPEVKDSVSICERAGIRAL
ncbi:MAG: HAD-IC family P-type ATPase, partial [Evtepia sp.]